MYSPKSGVNAGKANKKKIIEYLNDHPEATGVEISKELNLSKVTVYKQLAAIVKEYNSSKEV